MFYGLKKCVFRKENLEIQYITFGKGDKPLVMLSGLSFAKIWTAAYPLAMVYPKFAKEYKVYVFDRKENIEDGYTINDMADDTALAMKELGLFDAFLVGVSQGGMIAQRICAQYPELVAKLVLCVTMARQNKTAEKVVSNWIDLCQKRDFKKLSSDTIEKIYSDGYLKKYRWAAPFFSLMVSRMDTRRFLILAKSCLTFDGSEDLERISCPVLVLGGEKDKVLTGEASLEIAQTIGCEVYLYKDLSHAIYEEAKKDFDSRVYSFLKG